MCRRWTRTQAGALVQLAFAETLKGLARIIDSPAREAAYLEHVIHHAQEVRLAVQAVRRWSRWSVVLVSVIGAAMGEGQRMPKFVHQRSRLRQCAAYLVIAIRLAACDLGR